MNFDYVNAGFEGVGAVLIWRNVWALRRDREVKGIDWRVTGFWALWGLWNVAYYLVGVGHVYSAIAGAVLALGNCTWVALAWRLSRVPAVESYRLSERGERVLAALAFDPDVSTIRCRACGTDLNTGTCTCRGVVP